LKESVVNGNDAIGRRSAIICLICEILRKSRKALSLEDIRKSMAYGRLPTGKRLDVSGGLRSAGKRWLLLQVRQAQRLALESLMAWVEHRILIIGERDARQLVSAAVSNLRKEPVNAFREETPAEILAGWAGRLKTFDDYVDAALKDQERFCVFKLCEELEIAVTEEPKRICVPAFKLLMLARRFYEWLNADEEIRPYLAHGRSERISLAFWAKTWDKNSKYPLADLIALVLNNMVLSQHFAVTTNRFDGGTQRLRITIEEEGLEVLVGKTWKPNITPDRLGTVLSLMMDCELIKWDDDEQGYFA
jgi:hypothetical protein